MFNNYISYEGALAAQLALWKSASDNARASETAWLDITSRFHRSIEKADVYGGLEIPPVLYQA